MTIGIYRKIIYIICFKFLHSTDLKDIYIILTISFCINLFLSRPHTQKLYIKHPSPILLSSISLVILMFYYLLAICSFLLSLVEIGLRWRKKPKATNISSLLLLASFFFHPPCNCSSR